MSKRHPSVSKARTLVPRFTHILFSYYRKYGRRMPWRETRGPYRILVSEIMLQQTQVSRVRGKYEEFLRRFPTIQALARASLGDVLRIWSGLGYNRRAKHLHECARVVVSHGGVFPDTMEELTELPGIGRSTAAGILAFAWNRDVPMIDTNIRRVLTRVFFPRRKRSDRELYEFARSIIPKGKGRIWNYAMLDIAAERCTARSHREDCPLLPLHGSIREEKKRKKGLSHFEDTDRYARGRIVHALREQSSATVDVLVKAAARSKKKTEELLFGLIRDGLIVRRGPRYTLP